MFHDVPNPPPPRWPYIGPATMTKTFSFPISSLNAGEVSPFTTEAEGTTYTIEGDNPAVRLVRIFWKASKNNPSPRKAIWAAVLKVRPMTDEALELLGPWATVLHDRIDDVQDILIKEWLEAHAQETSGGIPSSELSSPAVLNWMRKDSAGKRLSQVTVREWFDSGLSELLMVKLSERIQDANKLATAVAKYREKFPALAAPVPNLSKDELESMQRVLGLIQAETPMSAALSERISSSLKRFEKDRDTLENI